MSLTIIFLIVVVTMYPFAVYSGVQIPVSTLIALLVCLIPTTIGGLLSAIGIAGMDRVTRFNVIAMSGKAVEACGDVDTMILDKTGTITFGNRLAADFFPVEGANRSDLIRCAALTSLHDDTPEGKSTLELARRLGDNSVEPAGSSFLEFTAQTRMSGVDLPDGTKVRKGASDAIEQYVKENGGKIPADLHTHVEEVSSLGGTPLVVCENNRILGVIYLKDTVKPGMVERFERLRAIGIKTIMCTGDNPLTAATIAKEAGVDGFIAECKPEDKMPSDQEGAVRGQDRRHDRRRHQRRPGSGPGQRGSCHELRHHRRQGGRQHGGPGLRPHQDPGGGGDRQAAADYPGLPDHLLHRQRHRQVLRHHPRHVHGGGSCSWAC